jgi:hypothetical protein
MVKLRTTAIRRPIGRGQASPPARLFPKQNAAPGKRLGIPPVPVLRRQSTYVLFRFPKKNARRKKGVKFAQNLSTWPAARR